MAACDCMNAWCPICMGTDPKGVFVPGATAYLPPREESNSKRVTISYGSSVTNLQRVTAFVDHGEELLTVCKALLADIEAGYGSIDALSANVKGIRLMAKVLRDIRRAHEAIAKIEPTSEHLPDRRG